MINVNIISRVVKISTNRGTGTAFFVDLNDSNNVNTWYLVTAKHLFNIQTTATTLNFRLLINNRWINYNLPVYIHNKNDIDIAVIKFESLPLRVIGSVNYNTNVGFSEQCYFMGYPEQLHLNLANINGSLIPLVKHGIVSAITPHNNITTMFIDGHNTRGFSGGPVVIVRNNAIDIFGVIIQNHWNSSQVFKQATQQHPKGVPTTDFVKENTGIAIAQSFDHVKEIVITIP